MDGISLATSIITIVQLLQKTFETLKDAPDGLEQVLAQANSLAALVKRLDSIEPFLSDDRRRFLASQFDRAACASTVQDLKTLVDKISPTEYGAEKSGFKKNLSGELALKPRVMWLLKESNAKNLSERMKAQCEQIANATDQILLECGLFMEKQLVELREAMLKQSKPMITTTQSAMVERQKSPSKPIITTTAQSTTVKRQESRSKPILTTTQSIIVERQEIPIWLGQYRLKQDQTLGMSYFSNRNNLSNSAYRGDWDRLLTRNLAAGYEAYNQNWINSSRIMKTDDRDEPSGYTPLHQAAWHGASTLVVEKLILLGAWRLARTVRNGLMQTPLDVAKRFGWAHLYSLLTPVIHHTLPASVLLGLQKHLDQVFAEVFPGATERFRVPQVEILTELKHPQLLVPLEAEKQNVENPIGVRLFLDERELVAQFAKTDGTTGVYRIREDGWDEIERGILLHYQQG